MKNFLDVAQMAESDLLEDDVKREHFWSLIKEEENNLILDILISDIIPSNVFDQEELLKRLGFIIGERENIFFRHGQLPPQWSKRIENKDRNIIFIYDNNNMKRGFIYFKNTSSGPKSSMRLHRRYNIKRDALRDEYGEIVGTLVSAVDNSNDLIIYDKGAIYKESPDYENLVNSACDEVYEWLNENYPQHESFEEYWKK